MKGEELLVVPRQLQNQIIKNTHEKGHYAVKKTEDIIKKEYYIPKLQQKIERVIATCIPCILSNRKRGKQEGFLHPLNKVAAPLDTYHVDHLGPLETTNKNYKYLFIVVDGFTKFIWLYPTKSTTSKEVIAKLEAQKTVFGNPARIIFDRGSAFTSNEFEEYCKNEGINHIKITTGLPRANGQVERMNSTVISVLGKLSSEDPTKWYKYVDRLQRILNSTYCRSIDATPFQLLTGVKMKNRDDLKLKAMLEEDMKKDFEDDREELRQKAKLQIKKVQEENKRYYNLRRKNARKYNLNDIVAIKKTQFDTGAKLKQRFYGPYKVTKVKPNDAYDVEKQGFHDGPFRSSSCAEHMKPWSGTLVDDHSSETE